MTGIEIDVDVGASCPFDQVIPPSSPYAIIPRAPSSADKTGCAIFPIAGEIFDSVCWIASEDSIVESGVIVGCVTVLSTVCFGAIENVSVVSAGFSANTVPSAAINFAEMG